MLRSLDQCKKSLLTLGLFPKFLSLKLYSFTLYWDPCSIIFYNYEAEIEACMFVAAADARGYPVALTEKALFLPLSCFFVHLTKILWKY